MKPITYKFVMDGGGLLTGVELWQGDQYIIVSMMSEGTHKSGYRWREVKDFMDNVTAPNYQDKLYRESAQPPRIEEPNE